MEDRDVSVLQEIAFSIGMGWVIFWPVWLVSGVLAGAALVRRERLTAACLTVVALIPLSIGGLFFGLLQGGVDVGSRDGFLAISLDALAWAYLLMTLAAVILIATTIVRWSAPAFSHWKAQS